MGHGQRVAVVTGTNLTAVLNLSHQTWREDSACRDAWRSGVEFVDPPPLEVDGIIREFCWRCPVVGACRTFGDDNAPHRHAVIYGARFYAEREPADGWEIAG